MRAIEAARKDLDGAVAIARPNSLRVVIRLFACILALAVMLGTSHAARGAEQTCENETVRMAQKATYLGDCRAYELVSPPSATPYLEEDRELIQGAQASADGEAIAWFSYYSVPGSDGGFFDRSTRGDTGWSTQSLVPSQTTWQGPSIENFTCTGSIAFSADLDSAVLIVGEDADALNQNGARGAGKEPEYCGNNSPSIVPNEPKGFENLFATSLQPLSYSLVDMTPSSIEPRNARFQDASADFSRIVFSENAPLTPEALAKGNLYEWFAGEDHLVSILPEGSPTEAVMADYAEPMGEIEGIPPVTKSGGTFAHAVSDSGAQIFFRASDKLYVRLHAEAAAHKGLLSPVECVTSNEACTIEIDASIVGGPGGGGRFVAANTEGSVVYFVDESGAELTSHATFLGESLYEFNVDSGQLKDLTPVTNPRVLGFSGVSEDGEYLYFASDAALVSGVSNASEPKLYVAHDGVLKFIATVGAQTAEWRNDWQSIEGQGALAAEASPNGEFLVFTTVKKLSTYNNLDKATGEDDEEVYEYDAVSESLSCVSCDPSGSRPVGSATLDDAEPLVQGPGPNRLRRNVLNDGTVFFNTPDPLVEGDTNGAVDVYEYNDGAVHLVSGGTATLPSRFYEASENGGNVFFITSQALLHSDINNGLSLYDARSDGGVVEQEKAPATCEEEVACKGAYSGSSFSTPISSTASGPGNFLGENMKRNTKMTRRQKRAKALNKCGRMRRRQARLACERRVRRAYDGVSATLPRARKAKRRALR